MAQGLLPFQYESEAGEAGLTGLAGLPLYLELWRAAGLDGTVGRHSGLGLLLFEEFDATTQSNFFRTRPLPAAGFLLVDRMADYAASPPTIARRSAARLC